MGIKAGIGRVLMTAFGHSFLAMPIAFAAETVTCTDADNQIRFSYGVDPDLDQPILWVEMQLAGDFGLSTDPAHRNHDKEYIVTGFSRDDVDGGDIAWRDERKREHVAMSFRIGRVFEAREQHIAGAVSVAGGGLWTVTCTEDEPETKD